MTYDKHKIEKLLKNFKSGRMCDSYRFFGSHRRGGVTDFLCFAPGADNGFLKYNGKTVPMEKHGDVWFVSVSDEVGEYRYIFHKDGEVFEKNDPFAFFVNHRQVSEFYSINKKPSVKFSKPDGMRIYELHAGSWIKDGGFSSVSEPLAEYLTENGYNFVELMPVNYHPCKESWGYQLSGYFAFSYGTPDEFAEFVDRMHSAGVGVIVDWVPGHFAVDSFGLSRFDGSCVFESEEAELSKNLMWGTVNADFSKPHVRSFMLSSACFLSDVFGVDGIRVDAVSNMIVKRFQGYRSSYGDGDINQYAVSFLKDLTYELRARGVISIAEDTAAGIPVTDIHGLGFDRVWNMGWFHDILVYLSAPTFARDVLRDYLLKPFEYMNNEKYILPLSHDENVHGKKSMFKKLPEDEGRSYRLLLGLMAAFPGDKLWFSGTEIAADREWDVNSQIEKNSLSDEMLDFSKMLNRVLCDEKVLQGGSCRLLGYKDGVLTFIRENASDEDDFIIFVFNFSDTGYDKYYVGIDRFTDFKEVFVTSGERECRKYFPEAYSINESMFRTEVNLPPLCGLALRPDFNWKKY